MWLNVCWTEIEVFLITVTKAPARRRTPASRVGTHGPGGPQSRTLHSPYSPAQCRPTCGMNTQLSVRHHVELRIAPLMQSSWMMTNQRRHRNGVPVQQAAPDDVPDTRGDPIAAVLRCGARAPAGGNHHQHPHCWSHHHPVSYTHLRAHETDSYLVCRLLLEKK